MPMMTTPLSLQTSKTTLTSSSMPLWMNTRLASKTPSTRFLSFSNSLSWIWPFCLLLNH
ncbi:hypothetical protein DY000_02057264 [Brassica cretica]|uniref:Uncharacterized protein n=1 Tax=Brassica cretica TaxID=69181 RepID=A0ABQ7AKC2_BRACR|nr:hypothetical protein DY000_02057264 [Brassica cretica]